MAERVYDVLVVGGGAGGISAASSLLKRNGTFDIGIIEPSDRHRYQPGYTLVGGGVFSARQVQRPMSACIPKRAEWLQTAVAEFAPGDDAVVTTDGRRLHYRALVVSPGIELNWGAIDGLADTLGQHGVTSNYAHEHAPYTWQLVQNLKEGRAVFSQPPMPIKCAGAPQKAVYLSCSEWERQGCLKDLDVDFYNAGGVLFGVPDYVPALEGYMDRYGVDRHYQSNLVAVDGPARKAYFDRDGARLAVDFDMLHVSPPQRAPAFVRDSDLADEAGWLQVDQFSLQHPRFANVFGLGDATSTPNAKTAAAVRKQAPVVAENVAGYLAGRPLTAAYDGYGSCPLTVERGKVVLAEFGYGGKLMPTAPSWINDGTRPTRLAWMLKASWLPPIYFNLMLKGREWFAKPETVDLAHADAPA